MISFLTLFYCVLVTFLFVQCKTKLSTVPANSRSRDASKQTTIKQRFEADFDFSNNQGKRLHKVRAMKEFVILLKFSNDSNFASATNFPNIDQLFTTLKLTKLNEHYDNCHYRLRLSLQYPCKMLLYDNCHFKRKLQYRCKNVTCTTGVEDVKVLGEDAGQDTE